MKTKSLLQIFALIAFILGIVTSCSSTKITVDYDKSTDFNTYKTFQFVGETSQLPMNDLDRNRLLTAIENQLISKGLTISENPELAVDIQLKFREEKSASSSSSYYGSYGRRGYGYSSGFSTTTINIDSYIVGTIFINLIDNAKNELVWQGVGEGTVDFDAKNREKNFNKNISKVFSNYPPETK